MSSECWYHASDMKKRQEHLWLEPCVFPFPFAHSLPPWFFPFPLILFIISLCSYLIIGLGKEFQVFEQHYAELSSRVISDANTCPPGECELSLLVSAQLRQLHLNPSQRNSGDVWDTLQLLLGRPRTLGQGSQGQREP